MRKLDRDQPDVNAGGNLKTQRKLTSNPNHWQLSHMPELVSNLVGGNP